jgi:hypothetical protein
MVAGRFLPLNREPFGTFGGSVDGINGQQIAIPTFGSSERF